MMEPSPASSLEMPECDLLFQFLIIALVVLEAAPIVARMKPVRDLHCSCIKPPAGGIPAASVQRKADQLLS